MGILFALKALGIIIVISLIGIGSANAHVSEQGIVLLLPTGVYILSGCLAVIASMLIVAIMPHEKVFRLFKPININLPSIDFLQENQLLKDLLSLFSLLCVIALIVIGAIGSRDPLVNLLPLTIWTFWWIIIVLLHCIVGNIWSWLNPWTGLYNQVFRSSKKWLTLPSKFGQWPAIVIFVAFYIFIIADLAPDDPARLSNIVLGYLAFTFIGMIVFGANEWLNQVECFTIFFKLISRLSPIQLNPGDLGWSIGVPGWKLFNDEQFTISQSFFLLTMLASGSFDGINETFWWLGKIGINPLAFPGRSAVMVQSTFGMLAANIMLYAIFAFCIWIGIRMLSYSKSAQIIEDSSKVDFKTIFSMLAISILPIAAVYHGSHYLTSLMVNGQYLLIALSDPLANGSNYLGIENYQVTTGYLNEVASVRKIWLTQAGLVVFGHIVAVLMAHFVITQNISDRKDAVIFHIPIAIFMASYTWFGLWLLAAPKGA